MARSHLWIGCASLCAGVLARPSASHADTKATVPVSEAAAPSSAMAPKVELDGPEAQAKERARRLFQQGVTAYRSGKYYEAVELFLQTQRIYPDTQLCFNIARTYENLGNASAALRYYRDYLRQADRPSDGDDVRARVRNLESQLAERGAQQLTVLSQPEGATVLLDGKPVGLTPFTGETYPGKHRLGLSLHAYESQERVVEVAAHTSHEVSLVLLPHRKSGIKAGACEAPRVADERPAPSLASLLTLGTAVVLLSSALVTEAITQESGASPPAAFLAGGGLGAGVAGGVMLYFDLAPRAKHTGTSPP